ncbi:Hypothetical predicted protein [Pelobates cultripes]|uniref:Uncharacterized protein n=1 Tax=Pelobates cultripes TaxID=61616 RepID=A0AAD1TDE2_PELCU|nr:Hypothetical predicted protein [Pelobates cultripes]
MAALLSLRPASRTPPPPWTGGGTSRSARVPTITDAQYPPDSASLEGPKMAAARKPCTRTASLTERFKPGQRANRDLAPKHRRMHQEAPQQPTKHSPPRRTPTQQQQPGALAIRKAPKWRRVNRRPPHQQRAPCEWTLPILKPADTCESGGDIDPGEWLCPTAHSEA